MSTVSNTLVAGLNLAGGIMQFSAQREQGRAAQRAEDINAGIARQEATISIASRGVARIREKKQLRNFVGTQDALFAKAGVTLSGSPIDIIRDTIEEGELDILLRDINAGIAQDRLQFEATVAEIRGQGARTVSDARAATTLLSSLSTFAGKFITSPKKKPDTSNALEA